MIITIILYSIIHKFQHFFSIQEMFESKTDVYYILYLQNIPFWSSLWNTSRSLIITFTDILCDR